MAYTQTDLDAIKSAIAQGATRVKYSDREVEYRSLKEMRQIRDMIAAELGVSTPSAPVRFQMTTSKGLESDEC